MKQFCKQNACYGFLLCIILGAVGHELLIRKVHFSELAALLLTGLIVSLGAGLLVLEEKTWSSDGAVLLGSPLILFTVSVLCFQGSELGFFMGSFVGISFFWVIALFMAVFNWAHRHRKPNGGEANGV